MPDVKISNFLVVVAWGLIRPALVSLGVTGILLLGGCKTATEKWLFENNNPPPAPDLETRSRLSVVLPPPLNEYKVYWIPPPGSTNSIVRWGGLEDAVTNLFGITDGWSFTNKVLLPDWADEFYATVTAEFPDGSTSTSYVEKHGGFPINAVVIDSVPSINSQVLLFRSPDKRFWTGDYTQLPIVEMITQTTFYRVAPDSGVPPEGVKFTTNGFPIELTISGIRKWNGTHYGK